MANPILILNQPQVFNGLGTLTYTNPTTGNYNVRVSSTFLANAAINSGANQSAGIGYATGGVPVGAGSGMGEGAGTGGGGEGFVNGDKGLGQGGVGQGFGASNGYQQPSAQASNALPQNPLTSGLSIVVNVNGSPVYTSVVPAVVQSAEQFKYSFQSNAGDVITVVLSSSVATDNLLSGVTSTIAINQGF